MKDRSVATLLLVVGASVIAVFLLLFASASSGASDLALEQPSEMRQLEMTDEPSPTPISFASRTFGTKARHPIGSIQACQPFATIVPDQMTPSGEVTTRDNCGDDTVRTWLDDAPTGTIMIGVDPRSPFPDDWDGGSATAEIYIDVVSPTVATVMVSWPDRHGKGIHSPDSEVTATVDVDGYPLWTKRALHRSTFGDYYAVQQPPVVLTFVATRAMTHTLTFRVPPHTAWDISEITVELCPMPSLKRGYGYAPFRYCQSPNEGIFPTVDEIEADIPFLFHNSNGIRTYASCGVQGKIPELAQKYGLSVAVGVWLGPDMEVNEQEISCAITVAKQYSDVVDSVIVGNEVLLRGDLTEAQLVTYINRVKAEVDVPVTTAEIWSVLKDHPAVIDAVDYLLVHIYSWWDAWYGTTITNPAKYVVDIYKEIQQQHPGKRVVIGETGWPSGGQSQGQAIPSLENQCRFYTEFLRLAIQENVEFYYFDVFDEPWKVEEPGGVGKHWGLNYGDRTTKYKIQGVRLTESVLNLDSICSQPNRVAYLPIMLREWSGPFPTPVPPTPTPDPTPTAPAFNIYTEHGAAFNHFFPSGHMDDIEDIGMYDCWPGDPHSGETAIKVHYSAEGSRGKGLAGVYWQEPENNWGTLRGGYDLTDATALTFWARGAQGGEQVEFLVGGIWPDLCEPFRNPDSLQPAASTDVMTLTNTWQKYTMDLRGKDLSNVIGGFAWASNACLNPDGAIFYLDDIKYEYGEDTAIPAPTPTPTEPYYFDVYTDKDVAGNHYIPTGFMGDYSDITLDECWRQDVHSGSTAIRAHYTAAGSEGNNWGAVAWVHPADNWGDRPGGYDLTGADALCLWAKGERGREKIEFKIGGIGYEAGTCVTRTLDCGLEVPYPDSVCPPVYEGVFTLTDQWEEYCLTLDESVDLSHVVGGFTWAADRSRNPDGATFYLDDIRYTFNLSATPTPTPTLFYVYADDGSPANHFVPSGWMGDTGDITVNEIYQGDTCSGTTAIRISYSAQGNGPSNSCDAYGPPCWWAGVYWQEPEGNWGTVPGAGFDLSEYNELAFCARGETGGERIEFGMGGLGRDAGTCAPASPYPDSACKVSTRKTLGIEWQEYTIDLTSQDLSYIIGGFMWATSQNENPTGAVFYVDEIRFRRK
jgi:exo-beta-1,3-glucanase (GH17 family)